MNSEQIAHTIIEASSSFPVGGSDNLTVTYSSHVPDTVGFEFWDGSVDGTLLMTKLSPAVARALANVLNVYADMVDNVGEL